MTKTSARALPIVLAALLALPALAPLADAGVYPTCISANAKPRDVVIVFDKSFSMNDLSSPSSTTTRFQDARTAVSLLLSLLSPTLDKSALVSFSDGWTLDRNLTFAHTVGPASTQAALNALATNGATALGAGMLLGAYELHNGLPSPAPNAPYSYGARANADHVMIVLSDGDQTLFYADPVSVANQAKAWGTIVYSIAIGTAISPEGLQTMLDIASEDKPSHFYQAPDATTLPAIFQQIFQKLNDAAAPTVGAIFPNPGRLYNYGADVGPSPVPGFAALHGPLTATVVASDDCLLDRLEWRLEVQGPAGSTIQSIGDPTTGVQVGPNQVKFAAAIDCDQFPAGFVHTLRATAVDFLGKRSPVTERTFTCLRAAVAADAHALSVRTTNPAEPWVTGADAVLPTPQGGSASSDFTDQTIPLAGGYFLRAVALHDEVQGAPLTTDFPYPSQLAASALSRDARLILQVPGGPDIRVLETSASSYANADPASSFAFAPQSAAGATTLEVYPPGLGGQFALVRANVCAVTPISAGAATVTTCADAVYTAPGVQIFSNEVVHVASFGADETTVNGLRILLERPEARAEIILAQSYAGASWLGEQALHGPWRALDFEDDAGLGSDAPDTFATAQLLAPGTYGGRIADGSDVDAYAFTAIIGDKLHVDLAASDVARVELGTVPPLPSSPPGVVPFATALPGSVQSTGAVLPSLRITLLDPLGQVRDDRTTLVAGGAHYVELNVDMPGDWVVLVRAGGAPGDYTMQATRTLAPMTQDNDALRGQDAGGSCQDALLVGPGTHVGTIEDRTTDASDFYRFQLDEGQIAVIALRPGDTVDAADMDLYFYDRACTPLAPATVVGAGAIKGAPEVVTFGVPPGASGLYRAEVRYKNGLGTYELAIATSVATL